MNAGEKIAWLELVTSLAAIAAVTALYPWLGNGATGAFGLLGLLGAAALFTNKRGAAVVLDERDSVIHQRGLRLGVFTGWMLGFMGMIAIVLWASSQREPAVPVAWLTWLVWVQFAVCYAVKGFVEVRSYRGAGHAS